MMSFSVVVEVGVPGWRPLPVAIDAENPNEFGRIARTLGSHHVTAMATSSVYHAARNAGSRDTTISVSRASSLLETAFCVLRSQSHAAKACRSHLLKMEAQNFSAECAPNLTNEKQTIKSA